MLYPKKLGLAGGILWGLCMFICTILSIHFGYATQFLSLLSDVYPGYTLTGIGSVVGLLYGFVDGFIGFYLLAWLYNRL